MTKNYFKRPEAVLHLFTIALLSIVFNATAQCPPAGITFSTQAEVDQFAIDYPNCTLISGALQIGPAISSEPGNITDLSPLANITNVTDNLYIQNNALLQNVDGLNITTVGGYLYVGGDNEGKTNLVLTNLDGLSSLTSVAKDIYIRDNYLLNDISGLENTTFQPFEGYGLSILLNPNLAVCNLPNFCNYLNNPAGAYPRDISGNLAGCVNVVAVAAACGITLCPPGNVTLTTQAQVNQFAIDYPFCTQINGYLTVAGNDVTNLNGLSNLTSTVGSLDITANPLLTDISGLSNITSVGQDLAIRNNAVLQSIASLNNINTIADGLYIQYNPQLQTLNALQNITTLTKELWIIGNSQLQSLNGLQNIVSIGGDLDVTANDVLNDITALENIDPTSITEVEGFGLTILDNPNVSVCNLPNLCTYLTYDATTHPRIISGNGGNCITEVAVAAACEALSVEDTAKDIISIYPNPVKDVLYFSEEVTDMKITDVSGRVVKQFSTPGKSVDLSNLSNGVYIASANTEDGETVIKKIIKE